MYVCVCVYIYKYIYIERERERERDTHTNKACFMGLTVAKKPGGQTVDLRGPVVGFVEIINSWPERADYAGQCDARLAGRERFINGFVTRNYDFELLEVSKLISCCVQHITLLILMACLQPASVLTMLVCKMAVAFLSRQGHTSSFLREFPMDQEIPPLRFKNLLESNLPKSRFLVCKMAVRPFYVLTSCPFMGSTQSGSYFRRGDIPQNTGSSPANLIQRVLVCELLA